MQQLLLQLQLALTLTLLLLLLAMLGLLLLLGDCCWVTATVLLAGLMVKLAMRARTMTRTYLR